MDTPHTPRNYLRGQARRQALAAAALNVLAEAGWHGAGVEELAARAGATKNQLFYHFKSKEGLALAVLDEALILWRAEVSGPAAMFPDPLAALNNASQALDRLTQQGWPGLRLWASLAADRPTLPPDLAELLDRSLEEIADFFRRRYREMKQRGWLDPAWKARALAGITLSALLGSQLTGALDTARPPASSPSAVLELLQAWLVPARQGSARPLVADPPAPAPSEPDSPAGDAD